MNRINVIRRAMVEAMRAKDKARKDSFSMLLGTLKDAEIDERSPLTEEEENTIVKKGIEQCQETFGTAPADQEDIEEEAVSRITVYKKSAPEDMSAEQIEEAIADVLVEPDTETPTLADRGRIMKVLMPKVKGKTGGKMVNKTLTAVSK